MDYSLSGIKQKKTAKCCWERPEYKKKHRDQESPASEII